MPPQEHAPLTAETAARAYERIRLYKAAIERAEAILKEYARTNPIQLEDGRVYGVRIDATRQIDGRVGETVLRDMLGPAATEAITVEVTQAGIKRALKTAAFHPNGLQITVEDVLAEIARRGGLKTIHAPKLVAHMPRKP